MVGSQAAWGGRKQKDLALISSFFLSPFLPRAFHAFPSLYPQLQGNGFWKKWKYFLFSFLPHYYMFLMTLVWHLYCQIWPPIQSLFCPYLCTLERSFISSSANVSCILIHLSKLWEFCMKIGFPAKLSFLGFFGSLCPTLLSCSGS